MFLWLKAFHVIAVIAWMAGLLYLPRLFVYHAPTVPGDKISEQLKTMERRLLVFIMTPTAVAVWLLGGLAMKAAGYGSPLPLWLVWKLVLVTVMTGMHGLLAWHWKQFETDRRRFSARYFRAVNEVPTILMIAIVLLVVLKPE